MQNALKLTFIGLVLVSSQALAGAILHTETREYHVDPPAMGKTTMLADGALLRVEINSLSSDEDGLIIYRGDRNELIVADNERLEYYVIDAQTMNRMAAQIRDALKEVKDLLSTMPPEERAEAEQMLQLEMPGLRPVSETPTTLRKTGESDTINGYDCEFFEVMQDGRRTRDMCVAEWGDIDGGQEAADAMIGMGKFFEQMHDAFAETAGTNFMGPQQEIFAQMRELGGYPIYARDYDENGALEGESTLKSSSAESVDAAKFEPPEGYRKQEMTP